MNIAELWVNHIRIIEVSNFYTQDRNLMDFWGLLYCVAGDSLRVIQDLPYVNYLHIDEC
jgi:hypothetical protein